jgi:hypothetical protein
MRTFLIALMTAGNAAAQNFSGILECPYNDAQPTDFVTYICLLDHHNHSEPAWCTEFDPASGMQVREAYRGWLDRNAAALKTIRAACDERVSRAYGGDAAAIASAREDARRRDRRIKEEIKERYWSGTQALQNCSAYIHRLKEARDEDQAWTKLLHSIRECRARPVQWRD